MSVQKIITFGSVAVIVVFPLFLRVGDQGVSKPVVGPTGQPTIAQAVSPSNQRVNVTIPTRQGVNNNAALTALSTQDQIGRLLESAEEAIAKYRLTTPSGDNARHYYDRVLALDPGNKDALAGIHDTVEHYRKMAMEAIREGLFRRAAAYVNRVGIPAQTDHRGLTVQPDDPGLLQIKKYVAPET